MLFLLEEDKELVGPVIRLVSHKKEMTVYMLTYEGKDELIESMRLPMKQYMHSAWAEEKLGREKVLKKNNWSTLPVAFMNHFLNPDENVSSSDESDVASTGEEEEEESTPPKNINPKGAKGKQLSQKEKKEIQETKEAVRKAEEDIKRARAKYETSEEIGVELLKRAPANFQARPLYDDNVQNIVVAMRKNKMYVPRLPPFMVVRSRDPEERKAGIYWLFDGNHNWKAMIERFGENEDPVYTKKWCDIYGDDLEPWEAAILGSEQNESVKEIKLNTEFDHMTALRNMCKDHNPDKDPPSGSWPEMNRRHMALLGKTLTQYAGKGGTHNKAASVYHEKFFAQKCTDKAFAALKKLYDKDPDLHMNTKYRVMNKLPTEVMEAILVWASERKKWGIQDWKYIKKMCVTLTDKHKELKKNSEALKASDCTKKKLEALMGAETEIAETAAEVGIK